MQFIALFAVNVVELEQLRTDVLIPAAAGTFYVPVHGNSVSRGLYCDLSAHATCDLLDYGHTNRNS